MWREWVLKLLVAALDVGARLSWQSKGQGFEFPSSTLTHPAPPPEFAFFHRKRAAGSVGRRTLAAGCVVSLDATGDGATTVERTTAAGPAEPGRPLFADASPARIREALTPEDAAVFDRHWRRLMQRATERLDLTELHEALESWRQVPG